MANKRTVVLKGCPVVNEDGRATATVKPGYLVKGVLGITHQTVSDGTPLPVAFALERSELGTGIDDAKQGSGTVSAFYASGDTVKVGVFGPGMELTAFIASGENIVTDDILQSAGDGTLKERTGTNFVVARAKEALGLIAAITACRVEVM